VDLKPLAWAVLHGSRINLKLEGARAPRKIKRHPRAQVEFGPLLSADELRVEMILVVEHQQALQTEACRPQIGPVRGSHVKIIGLKITRRFVEVLEKRRVAHGALRIGRCGRTDRRRQRALRVHRLYFDEIRVARR